MFKLSGVDPGLATAYDHMEHIGSSLPRSTMRPSRPTTLGRIAERETIVRDRNNSLCVVWFMVIMLAVMIVLLYVILYFGLHPCSLTNKPDSNQMVLINQTIQDLLDLRETNNDYRQFIQMNDLLQEWMGFNISALRRRSWQIGRCKRKLCGDVWV